MSSSSDPPHPNPRLQATAPAESAPPLGEELRSLLWDVFCRVIDNHGDLGVCWRLARELASRGHRVRLWIDDPSALAWMAPEPLHDLEMQRWTDFTAWPEPGDVVIEAFGCDLPHEWVNAMLQKRSAPVWINLEYLSAENYVERSHGLPSPQRNGLLKWFFFPGFSEATGGLLREADLIAERDSFDREAWWAAQKFPVAVEGERTVSLFCYPDAPLDGLLQALAQMGPALVLAAPGPAAKICSEAAWPPGLRWQALPWLPQTDYDRLLWSCDLNLVRGEDSFVRAQWAGRPFLWHIYPQEDGVHAGKLSAFLDQHLAGADVTLATSLRSAFAAWNCLLAPGPAGMALPDLSAGGAWTHWSRRRSESLSAQSSLFDRLLELVAQKAEQGS